MQTVDVIMPDHPQSKHSCSIMPPHPRLVLASTSPYRRELLSRLQLPFATCAPDIDESALPEESPQATAERLSLLKARAVSDRFPDALIIGSDQVACQGSMRFGKPGSKDKAIAQLRMMSGKSIVFHTGLCLLNSGSSAYQLTSVATNVEFRPLTDPEIQRYLDKEDALNCAGSARAEGLGIALLERLSGDDPNALIGLPLIALSRMLRAEGISLP